MKSSRRDSQSWAPGVGQWTALETWSSGTGGSHFEPMRKQRENSPRQHHVPIGMELLLSVFCHHLCQDRIGLSLVQKISCDWVFSVASFILYDDSNVIRPFSIAALAMSSSLGLRGCAAAFLSFQAFVVVADSCCRGVSTIMTSSLIYDSLKEELLTGVDDIGNSSEPFGRRWSAPMTSWWSVGGSIFLPDSGWCVKHFFGRESKLDLDLFVRCFGQSFFNDPKAHRFWTDRFGQSVLDKPFWFFSPEHVLPRRIR